MCSKKLRFIVGLALPNQPNAYKHVYENDVKKTAIEQAMILSERENSGVMVFDRSEYNMPVFKHMQNNQVENKEIKNNPKLGSTKSKRKI